MGWIKSLLEFSDNPHDLIHKWWFDKYQTLTLFEQFCLLELEYEYCNGGGDATYEACRASCQAMNTENESGWDLAIIPTEYHNEQIMEKIAVDFPFEESPFRLNLFWIGLMWVPTLGST